MANSESQRDRACASDAENHFLLLELFLASVHVVAETAKSVIQVLNVGIQDRALGKPFHFGRIKDAKLFGNKLRT